jgi:hypothetical protein
VYRWTLKVGHRESSLTPFQTNDFIAGCREFLSHDAADHTDTDDHHINFL